MPNHVTNIVSIIGDRLIVKEMLEKIKNDEYGIGTIDFNRLFFMICVNTENGIKYRIVIGLVRRKVAYCP